MVKNNPVLSGDAVKCVQSSLIILFLVMAFIFFGFGCSMEEQIAVLHDTTVPQIELTSPLANSFCPGIFVIEGRVFDYTNKRKYKGSISSLKYAIIEWSDKDPDNLISLEFDKDGFFRKAVFVKRDNIQMPLYFILLLKAVDGNNNIKEMRIPLQMQRDSEIPVFTAEQQSGKILLKWDSIPDTKDYVLDRYGIEVITGEPWINREEIPINKEQTSCIYEPASPGKFYSFILHAYYNAGRTLSSFVLTEFVHSPLTFLPELQEAQGSIVLKWQEITTVPDFEIYRSEPGSPDLFHCIGSIKNGFTYKDTMVVPNMIYAYKVKPACSGGQCSYAVRGMATSLLSANASISLFAPSDFPAFSHDGYHAIDVLARGNYVYLLVSKKEQAEYSLLVWDITKIENIQFTYELVLNKYSHSLYQAGDYLFINNYCEESGLGRGMQIIDLRNPVKPELFANILEEYTIIDFVIRGDFIYALLGGMFFAAFEMSPPVSAKIVGTKISMGGEGQSIHINGNYAYLITRDKGLSFYKIIDPREPQLIYEWNQNTLLDIEVYTQHIYGLHSGGASVNYYNFLNPYLPYQKSLKLDPGAEKLYNVIQLKRRDNFLFALKEQQLEIYGIKDEIILKKIATCDTTLTEKTFQAFSLQGDFIFIAAGKELLQVLHVHN